MKQASSDILFIGKPLYQEIAQQAKGKLNHVRFTTFEELSYFIAQKRQEIRLINSDKEMSEFSQVIVQTWLRYLPQAAALACYLDARKIDVWDSEIRTLKGISKLDEFMRAAQAGLPLIPTFYTLPATMRQLAEQDQIPFTFPLVVKDINGKKGKDNYLVSTKTELLEILAKGNDFMLQPFIPNDYDLRVLLYHYQPVLVIKRQRQSKKTHLNNTSQGAKASIIELQQVDNRVLKLAVKAAKVLQRELCGVDILVHENQRDLYLLEANNSPQIVSGTFTEEKIAALITELVH